MIFKLFIASSLLSSSSIPIITNDINTMKESSVYISSSVTNNNMIEGFKELNKIYDSIDTNSNSNDIYKDINMIITNYRVIQNIKEINRNTPQCKEKGDKVIDELNTIFEYFSISNDAKSKVMISDSFPGQKSMFIKNGLSSIQYDSRALIFCNSYNSY